jgi:hypothetical protein
VTRQRYRGTSDHCEASSGNAQVSFITNVVGEASTVVVLWLQLGHQQCASRWFVAAGSQNHFMSYGRMPFPQRGQTVFWIRHLFSCRWRRAISRLRACSSQFVFCGSCDLVHLLRHGGTLARPVFAFALCVSCCLGCSCMLSTCLRQSADTPNNR